METAPSDTEVARVAGRIARPIHRKVRGVAPNRAVVAQWHAHAGRKGRQST